MSARSLQPDDDPSVARWDKQRFGVQLILSGLQETQVLARDASAAGMAHGCIAIRIGKLLIYVEDRDALASLPRVVEEAGTLEDEAFGRQWAPTYRPRSPMRR